MIALQVVRTSFGFHFRECMGNCYPSPPPPEREVAADSRANNSAATHDISASRSGWNMQKQLGGCLVE